MTKGEYCREKKIHFCNPKFNPKEEADEKFMNDIDEIVNLVRFKEQIKEKKDDNSVLPKS